MSEKTAAITALLSAPGSGVAIKKGGSDGRGHQGKTEASDGGGLPVRAKGAGTIQTKGADGARSELATRIAGGTDRKPGAGKSGAAGRAGADPGPGDPGPGAGRRARGRASLGKPDQGPSGAGAVDNVGGAGGVGADGGRAGAGRESRPWDGIGDDLDLTAPGADGEGAEDDGEGAEDDGDGPGIKGLGKGFTVKDLAEVRGVPVSTIYAELMVPVGDGELASLGEIKDMAMTAAGVMLQQESDAERQESAQLELMVEREQLSRLVQAIGPVNPQVRQQLEQNRIEHLHRERGLLLKAIPEWTNPVAYQADQDAIVEFIGHWGFKASDFNSISDHKMLRMLRDVTRRIQDGKNRVQSARENSQPGARVRKGSENAPSPRVGSSSELQRLILKAKAKGAHKRDKLGAIAAMLGG